MVAGFAETSRPPFDLPEADAELVQGYQTEFGGMRFGTFYMAEYMEIVVISGVATAVFLGGWHGPGPLWLGPPLGLLKTHGLVFFFLWVRATPARPPYEQLISF